MALTPTEEAQTRALIAQEASLLSLAGSEPTIMSKLGATKVTLSDLVPAVTPAAGDLLLARQSTTDKSMTLSVLAGFILGQGGTTPPQFDADTSLATTEFVKRQGLQSADVRILTGSATLTAADVGKTIVGGSSSGFTATLPLLSTVPAGARFEFTNMNAGAMSVQRQGSDIINTSVNRLTEVLGTGDSLVLVASPSGGYWYAVGGTNQMTYAAKFAANLAGSGYQKLPSGLIIQWGASSGTVGTIALPIAFPTSGLSCVGTPNNTAATATNLNVNFASASALNFYQSVAVGFSWIAIGY